MRALACLPPLATLAVLASLASLALLAAEARADSPLTSCELHTGYRLSILDEVEPGRASPPVIAFLVGGQPLDEKIAVASAIGWSGGKTSGVPEAVVAALAARQKVPRGDLSLRDLSPEDRAILAYLLSLADYFDMKPLGGGNDLRQATPKKLLASAARERPEDFSIAYLAALVEAQAQMSNDKKWCAIYEGPAKVLARFPEAQRKLKPAAVGHCQEYIEGYREYCPHLKPPPESAKELDEVYAIALLGTTLLAGTQGGAVAIDTSTGERLAVAPDFICADVAVVDDQALFGCRRGLYLYADGAIRKLKGRADKGQSGFELLKDRDGTLRVLDGRRALKWDGRALVSGGSVPAPGAYARIIRRHDGALWSIDFMRAVHAGDRVLAVKGPYPGRDPRSFVEDATGDLWILDFDDGAFHYDDTTGSFQRAGPSNQASGVAVDPQTGRRVFLHYRDGLTFEASGQSRRVAMPRLEYMRQMRVSDDGTVWVAGWHGVAAVPSAGGPPRYLSLRGQPPPSRD